MDLFDMKDSDMLESESEKMTLADYYKNQKRCLI